MAADGARRFLIAADTGGTFTDLAVYDTATGATTFGKTLTTYGDLVEGVIAGLEDTGAELSHAALFKHGTTRHQRLHPAPRQPHGLIATAGFRDVLEIGRGNRPETFNLRYRRGAPLVPRSLRFEVTERMDGQGRVVTPLDVAELEALAPALRQAEVESIAISFLNSYANAVHEEQARAVLRALLPDVYITTGTELSREWMEYERTLDGGRQRVRGRPDVGLCGRLLGGAAWPPVRRALLHDGLQRRRDDARSGHRPAGDAGGIRADRRLHRCGGLCRGARHRPDDRLRHGRHHHRQVRTGDVVSVKRVVYQSESHPLFNN